MFRLRSSVALALYFLIGGCDDAPTTGGNAAHLDQRGQNIPDSKFPNKDLRTFISGRAFFPNKNEHHHLFGEAFRADGRWFGEFDGVDITFRFGRWSVEQTAPGQGKICVRFDKSNDSEHVECREVEIADDNSLTVKVPGLNYPSHKIYSDNDSIDIYFKSEPK